MIRRIFVRLCAAAVTAVVPLAAQAADAPTLKFANPGAPQGDVATQILQPWIAKVNDDAAGSFRVQLFSGPALGAFPQIYDRVAPIPQDLGRLAALRDPECGGRHGRALACL